MENNKTNYVSRIGNNIPKDVKEYVLKRVKEGGKSVAERNRGSNPLVYKLQKENQLLKQLVAELSLKIRESEKRGW